MVNTKCYITEIREDGLNMGDYKCPNCKEVFYDRHIEVEDEYNGWAHCDAHDEENTCPECGEQLEEL